MQTNSPSSKAWTLELVDDSPPSGGAGWTVVPGSPAPSAPGPTPIDPLRRLDLPALAPAEAPRAVPAPAPVDAPQRHGSPANAPLGDAIAATPAAAATATTAGDRFLAEAIREMQDGHIDRALWTRALALSGGDKDAATPGYLKARATALKLKRRERVAETSERRARAAQALVGHEGEDEDSGVGPVATERPGWMPASNAKLMRTLLAAGAGAVGLVLVWVFAFPQAPVEPAAAASARPAAAARRDVGPAVVTPEQVAAKARELDDEFTARMQALKEAGNWNVLVLQASEWTRRRPDNANAWGHLSMGYARLKQRDDAYDAAKKAVQLGPEDPSLWRNLGQVTQALNLPDDAIRAYQQAIALNDRDIDSLAQIGVLNTQQGRLPEAKSAFDRVLALIPEDTEALCGQAMIAQKQGRAKDADAIVQKLKASDRGCVDRTAPAAPPATTASVAPGKAAPSGRR